VETSAIAAGGSKAQTAWQTVFGEANTASGSRGGSNSQQCGKQQPAKGSGRVGQE